MTRRLLVSFEPSYKFNIRFVFDVAEQMNIKIDSKIAAQVIRKLKKHQAKPLEKTVNALLENAVKHYLSEMLILPTN